jgi:hypothetical protein
MLRKQPRLGITLTYLTTKEPVVVCGYGKRGVVVRRKDGKALTVSLSTLSYVKPENLDKPKPESLKKRCSGCSRIGFKGYCPACQKKYRLEQDHKKFLRSLESKP